MSYSLPNSISAEDLSKKAKSRNYLLIAPAFFILLVSLNACDWIKPSAFKSKVVASDPNRDVSADPANLMVTSAEKFAFHRWLVTEMQQQVFSKPAKGREDIDAWANVLSQRGSVEGVYHGLVLSSEYAAMEVGKADLRALRFFAQEMAAMDYPNSADSDEIVRKSAEKYAKDFMGRSIFTLKRMLGDRVIHESSVRKGDKDRLATWYANFVGRWGKSGVKFGLPQRDNVEEAFHFRWAKENNLGMIQWELLNRAHRILNAYGNIAQTPVIPAGK